MFPAPHRFLPPFCCALGLAFHLAPAEEARPGTVVSSPQPLAWSTLNFRAGAVGGEFDTYGDVFAPLWQNDRALLFIQPYSRETTGMDTDVGGGLGVRGLVTDNWALGLNAFYDHGWFHGGDPFDASQFGAGLELTGTWLDFRANYYLPQTGTHVVGRERVGERLAGLGAPYGTGHSIMQDYEVLGINREHLAAAGKGWDAEIGTLVPWLDQWLETRAYVGGYWYENAAGPDLKGLKARVETRLTRWLYADAGWIEDREVADGSWFAGVRVSLPLGKTPPPPARPQPPVSSLGHVSKARTARERMNEGVERNSRPVLATRSERLAEEVLGGRKSLTLYDDIVFVDSKAGAFNGEGTFERPVRTIQGGVDRSARTYGDNGTVFVQGRPAGYDESVVLRGGVRLYGSGYGLPVISPFNGRTAFHGRTISAPLVTGGFLAHDIAAPVGIAGFELTGALDTSWVSFSGRPAAGTNIFLENVASAVVERNFIHDSKLSSAGIYVEVNGANRSQVVLKGNIISGNPGKPGLGFQGVVLDTAATGLLSAVLLSNTIAHNQADGLAAANFDVSTLNIALSANFIGFNGADQIVSLNFGGVLNYQSAGTLNNTVLEAPGAASLYEFFSGTPQGAILMNGTLHPADTNLP